MIKPFVVSFVATVSLAILAFSVLQSNTFDLEHFSFAKEMCDKLRKSNAQIAESSELLKLCDQADRINPDETCDVDCDMSHLCGNPATSYCKKAGTSDKVLCDVSYKYSGDHVENSDIPRVYRLRKGSCVVSDPYGKINNSEFSREILLSFPDEISVVGHSLKSTTSFSPEWSVSVPNNNGGQIDFPTDTDDFKDACISEAGKTRVAARVPVAFKYETSKEPGGKDHSLKTDVASFKQRVLRAKEHHNQPPLVFVGFRFKLLNTHGFRIGAAHFNHYSPGQTPNNSPVSNIPLPINSHITLCVGIEPKNGKITSIREVIVTPENTHISLSRREFEFDAKLPIEFSGEEPDMWLGLSVQPPHLKAL